MSSRPNPIFGVLRLAVVLAAGAAGWFGYDMYVERDAEAQAAVEAEEEARELEALPWPTQIGSGDVRWTGNFRVTSSTGEQTLAVSDHQAETGYVRSTLTPNGAESALLIETDGLGAWSSLPTDPVWSQDLDLGMRSQNVVAAYEHSTLTLRSIVPPATWPYVVLNGVSNDAIGNTVLDIRIKSVAFHTDQPSAALQWQETAPFSSKDQPLDLQIIVDTLGRVVSVDSSSSFTTTTITELPTPPVFQSPLGDR